MSRNLSGWSLILSSVLALGLSTYLLGVHVKASKGDTHSSICDINEVFTCGEVAASKYSEVAGVPVVVPSAGLYLALALLVFATRKTPDEGADGLVLLGASVGFAASVGMALISKFVLAKWCLFCIGLYVISAGVLLLARSRVPSWGSGFAKGLASLSRIPYGMAGVGLLGFVLGAGSMEVAYSLQMKPEKVVQSSSRSSKAAPTPRPIDPQAYKKAFLAKPVKDIPRLDTDPILGAVDSPVTVIEFADFECPFCGQFYPEFRRIEEAYADRVAFVFRHYPLDQKCNPALTRAMHTHACDAAVASECARRQGKFWEMTERMFAHNKKLAPRDLQGYAKRLGLDIDTFRACTNDPELTRWIEGQVAFARSLSLPGTPSIFVNGRSVEPDPAKLAAAIEIALEMAEETDQGSPDGPHEH